MLIFKHRHFHKWAKAEKLSDNIIKKAIQEMNDGLYDVNLGGGLYKKRLARIGRGKSAGYRVLIIFKSKERAFFVYGFSKNEKENIEPHEKESYKILAHYYLSLTNDQLETFIQNGELIEVKCNEEKTYPEKRKVVRSST